MNYHYTIGCHVGHHAGLFIYSDILGPLGPQALLLSEVGRSPHFPPMRDFRFQCSRALKLCCEVPLMLMKHEFTFEDISSSSLSNCASDDNLDKFSVSPRLLHI